jgi:hypothetical protein
MIESGLPGYFTVFLIGLFFAAMIAVLSTIRHLILKHKYLER